MKLKKELRKERKQWERAVNTVVEKDNESKIIKDARKKLLMGLFDDYAREQLKKGADHG